MKNINIEDPAQVDALLERVLGKMESENKTLQEVLNVNDATIEELYAVAYAQYNQGQYKEALLLFRTLVNIAPRNAKFLFGLGSCFYQMKDYENGAISFNFALYHDMGNALAAYYASDCFLQRGEKKAADELLKITIEICEGKREYKELKERCKLIRNNLNFN